jgi:hypothetical protein
MPRPGNAMLPSPLLSLGWYSCVLAEVTTKVTAVVAAVDADDAVDALELTTVTPPKGGSAVT